MKLDSTFQAQHGKAVEIFPDLVRVTAPNPGPFTFEGTNSYLVGSETLAVIDPGPDQSEHFDALRKAIAGRTVSHIFVTHSHRDHTGLLPRLAALTGAETVGEGPHRASRPMRGVEVNMLEASSDHEFEPDVRLSDSSAVSGDGWTIEAVHTPGHTANHCAFALKEREILFSGDHVMAWATSVVAPPDGSMAAYMDSLHKLLAREERMYLPGHGGPVTNPKTFTKALIAHRKLRERAILQRLGAGDEAISLIVAALYRDIDPRLRGAAALSVFAHMEHLAERGRVRADGGMLLDSRYFAV